MPRILMALATLAVVVLEACAFAAGASPAQPASATAGASIRAGSLASVPATTRPQPATATATAAPSPQAAPGIAPTPVADEARPTLHWTRGRLPEGLVTCEDGCEAPWGWWPAFDGLAIAFGTDGFDTGPGKVRLVWSKDGRRWERLTAPAGLLDEWNGWIQSDGTSDGAFAYGQAGGHWRVWRTTDRGRTWRPTTGIRDWPEDVYSIANGAGHFAALGDDPQRLLVSNDGWAWQEILPLPAEIDAGIGGVLETYLSADAAGFVADVSALGGSDARWLTTSADGRIWSLRQPLPWDCGSVHRVPAGFVGFLGDGDCSDASYEVLTSPDGSMWTSRGPAENSVTAVPGGFLRDVWDGEAGPQYDWSRDGIKWLPLGGHPARALWFNSIEGRRIFAFGAEQFWSAELRDPLPAGGPVRPR